MGGTVITARGRRQTNVYVRDGLIRAIVDERLPAKETVDATGLQVLPGAIDGHVHFQDPGDTTREDFTSGSSAAAVGGVTTVIEHTHSDPVRTVAFLREKIAHASERSLVDFGLAAHAWPDDIGQHADLWHAGVTFFKVFTCTTHGIPAFDAAGLLRVFRELAAIDALCLVHCEDESITADAERALKAAGRRDPGILSEWRNREAELTALNTVALLARITQVAAIAAHVSHPAAVDVLQAERARGAKLWVETCPQYLYLREDEVIEHAGFRKFTPPARVRSQLDSDEMWRRVSSSGVTHISTDHAPSTRKQKTDGSIWDVHFGLPGVETTLNLLISAAIDGLLTLERVVELTSDAPARLYGLQGRKGRLVAGADADLVLIDLAAQRVLRDEDVISKAGWTPYAGRRIRGRIASTYVRGALVAQSGKPIADAGSGRYLPGRGLRTG
jgi:Dihydroorotase and related cyclic amidohydrolases